MAWFRPMGADEVAYHQATVVGRGDDHPGQALDYYGSRGETPLRWGGAGAARLGLVGEVAPEAYEAAFGPGGFRDPTTGDRLVATRRPGFELVVSAHKSVAMLGVIDRADDMHSILDVETTETMAWLDQWTQERGGRRGRDQIRTATGGLTYAVTRHATSRAGDPSPHDHVLVANLVQMLDDRGGFKGLDSAALRDTVEAATMVGRLHAAARAVELGFDIEPDNGPSCNLRHWRIVGIPDEVCEVFSKRSDEIAEHLATNGQTGYRARGVAARATRSAKRHTGADELLPAWRAELAEMGWPLDRLVDHLASAQAQVRPLSFPLTDAEIEALAADVLNVDGRLLANHKVFTRTNLVAEVAPRLYGRDPAELDRIVARMLASPDLVPLIGVAGAREQSFTTVEVLAAEATIADAVDRLANHTGPSIDADHVARFIAATETSSGRTLTAGQRRAVEQLCSGCGAVSLIVGVAGSGKTTALDVATDVLESTGYRVLGTSTSGQAARTLGTEAHIDARTFASMIRALDDGHLTLDARTVVVVDESGMADDVHLARVVLAVERAGAALALVGDPRQLPAVGPGGALRGLLDRHPELVVTLDENIRQRDPAERTALAELRNGSLPDAIDWYARSGRIHATPNHTGTLVAMVDARAQDIAEGHDPALLAWRRVDVERLNRLARDHWDRLGRLSGPDVEVVPGRRYAVGDRLIAVAPNRAAGIVTSEPLTVLAAEPGRIEVRRTDGAAVRLAGEQVGTDHLDFGYALTVHRTQGATCDRAHVLAAGGGRELAYVAMSRARDRSDVYVTADDIDQAQEDLTADWSGDRHRRWVTDTPARPGIEPPPRRELATRPHDGSEQLLSPADRRGVAERSVDAIQGDYRDLMDGAGRWANTPAGVAARSLKDARDLLAQTQQRSQDPRSRWRERRAAAKAIPDLEDRLEAAQRRWDEIGEPSAADLRTQVSSARRSVQRAETDDLIERLDRLQQHGAHPALERDRGMGLGL